MAKTYPRDKENHQINKLPIRTVFCEDESISSWMIRAALNQGCDPLTFTQYYWARHRLWTLDLDKGFDHFDPTINIDVSKLAETDVEKIVNFHTFSLMYKQMKYGEDFYKKNTSWIIPLAKRNRVRFIGYQYCPICFNDESTEPYLRIYWRFTWNIFCTVHKVLLQNKCPSCGDVYQPQLLDATSRHINHCYYCKSDLFLDNYQQAIDHFYKDRALNFQLRAHNVYLNGSGRLLGQELQFKDWFDTVLFFLNIIRKGKENPDYMFGLLLNEFNIPLKAIQHSIEPLSINFLSAVTRCELFSTLELMMIITKEEWIVALLKYNVTQNSFHWSKNSVIPKGFYPVYQNLPELAKLQVASRASCGVKSKKTIAKEWTALEKQFKRMGFYEKCKST